MGNKYSRKNRKASERSGAFRVRKKLWDYRKFDIIFSKNNVAGEANLNEEGEKEL